MLKKPSALLICLLLGAITLALFWPAHSFDFIRLDDNDYVTGNTQVQAGLTWEGVAWAFQKSHASNWHPLTWLSHMLDCSLYGLKPGGHHLTNVLFHTANAMLLLLLLNRLTGTLWPSCVVAALFAWHPAHVESVAWVAERKDVLSTFFGLLTLAAYTRYAAKPKTSWYLLTFFLFILSLMSKPMLVTLPCVMLLLDYWPLRRMVRVAARPAEAGIGIHPELRIPHFPFTSLLLEKIPLFAASLLSCVLTIQAQQKGGAIMSGEILSFDLRIENALISYIKYIRMAVWPEGLAIFYPHPGISPTWQAGAALGILVGISVLALKWTRRAPYFLVGWFWFLGTLVPVIGFLQVGSQALADRYTYFPFIGLFIAVVWGATELGERWKLPRLALNGGAVALLAGCLLVTRTQLHYWRNTAALFEHARQVTDKNYLAYTMLAGEFDQAGMSEQAMDYLNTALSYNPVYPVAYFCRGDAYFKQRKYAESLENLREATRLAPTMIEAHNEAGAALSALGKVQEAEAEFNEALKIDPGYVPAQLNLGLTLVTEAKPDEAIPHLNAVLAVKPDSIKAHLGLAKALAGEGKFDAAVPHFQKVLQLKPDDQEAHQKLGMALMLQGHLDDAFTQLSEATRLNPADAVSEYQLGLICSQKGNVAVAIQHYNAALRFQPDYVEALNNLAWIRAANENPEFRNGTEAVQLAQRACDATQNSKPFLLGTLAAAYAEAGQFTNAVATATQARDLALAQNQKSVADKNQELLLQYQANRPYHESAKPSSAP